MNQHNTPRNLRLLSVVALSGALMVSGCTDDSEEANKDDTSTASGATAEDAGVTGACDAYTDITLAMAEAPDGDPPQAPDDGGRDRWPTTSTPPTSPPTSRAISTR